MFVSDKNVGWQSENVWNYIKTTEAVFVFSRCSSAIEV
jgi:hypothetical protein